MSIQVITVTLSPSIDVTLLVDGLDTDKTNRVLGERRDVGGKGINVSRTVNAFGINNACLAVAGEDNRLEFADFLKAVGLRFELLPIPGAVRENLTLRAGKQTIKLNRSGPELSHMMTGALMALILRWVRPGDIVVFAGSLPARFEVQDFVEIVLATKQAGARVALDCDVLRPEHLQLIRPWLIKPNIHELRLLCPQQGEVEAWVAASARQLSQAGVENALISLGGDGMYARIGERAFRITVPAVEVKSTVGAGDSALAGFAVGFIQQRPAEDCCRLAAACGTASVMQEGTKLATREDALRLFEQVEVREVTA
ncbi:MAG: 1-phosphofructokinase family hexose kinase [Clostridia bacterium]|nr:1-phosphofructokinase family hexose kinase [Clostridia bacterium]